MINPVLRDSFSRFGRLSVYLPRARYIKEIQILFLMILKQSDLQGKKIKHLSKYIQDQSVSNILVIATLCRSVVKARQAICLPTDILAPSVASEGFIILD